MTWKKIFEEYIKDTSEKSVVEYLDENYSVPLPKQKNYTLNKNNSTIVYNGVETRFQKKTFQVLYYIYSNRERIVTRDEIYLNVWENMIVEERTIDVHIRKIRKEIPKIPIRTIKKTGLIWTENNKTK